MEFHELSRLASGHVEARIVQTAVVLGVFDVLADGPMAADQAAPTLQADGRAMGLLLNALVALKLLNKEGGRFSLTPAAETYLVSTAPRSLAGMIRFDGSLWDCWGRLEEAVRTGRPARSPDMYQSAPEETATFIGAMDALVRARGDAEFLAGALDWAETGSLLDVGSGPGTYPIFLCRRFKNLSATIFDLPGTLAITRSYVEAAGLENRIRLVSGDYRRDAIPERYDVVFLSNIIHGESYEENESLLDKLAGNLTHAGRLIIKDHVLDENETNPPVGAIFAILMLLTTASGRCFTFGEIKTWLERAGLHNVARIDLPEPFTSSLVIGRR